MSDSTPYPQVPDSALSNITDQITPPDNTTSITSTDLMQNTNEILTGKQGYIVYNNSILELKTIYTCILNAPAINKSLVSLIFFKQPPPGT